ncbi:uncharacterized protein LOC131011771 [Salvia miltiorrhiza]|uniref:uncharacterized protein LOC131011771 n=1 Tax=Salvia miltiorrhiza TaxID=226208 RepID=UPI0025AD1F6B|nr:uncharacterized protein LOC131011771 [Salvia miltiorrhiza]
MSISKSFFNFRFVPAPDSQPSKTRKSMSLFSSSSSCLAILKNHYQTRLWISKKHYASPRRLVVRSVVQPGVPPPSEPPFNFIKWILGVAITVVLPFFSGKWTSLLKIKNEVEMAVETAEEIVDAVEKAAEGVEKAAEKLAEDLPEGGGLRKAVDFVEHVAEIANKDAHKFGDFIDKVQEVEEKVEDYVECVVEGAINHEHHKEDNQENGAQNEEEDRAQEPTKEEEDVNDTGKH